MKAMVLAAGLGTRLKPITFEVPKPMVPVLDRPVMAHIVGLLERQGFDELIANLHYYPEAIRSYFGDRLEYRFEEELLGTAGGVRNVADFFGDEEVVVVSGDALTDLDVGALVERHRSGRAASRTLTVKKVPDTREYGVVIHDADGRIQGFQEKPEPSEALSDLGNCGIYCFSPEIFDYFPQEPFADWAQDVFPALLENDVPSTCTRSTTTGTTSARSRSCARAPGTRWTASCGSRSPTPARAPDGVEVVDEPVWVGAGVEFGEGVRLMGPVAIGDGCRIGDGAALRDSIVFPGTSVEEGEILIGAIHGGTGIVDRLRPLEALR